MIWFNTIVICSVTAVNMIFDSIDDLRCIENIANEEDFIVDDIFQDKQLHRLLNVSVSNDFTPWTVLLFELASHYAEDFHARSILFQLYDLIAGKMLSSSSRPPKDVYYVYRDVVDLLRDVEDSLSFSNNDPQLKRIIRDLLELLFRPHFKVSKDFHRDLRISCILFTL